MRCSKMRGLPPKTWKAMFRASEVLWIANPLQGCLCVLLRTYQQDSTVFSLNINKEVSMVRLDTRQRMKTASAVWSLGRFYCHL